MGDIPNRRTSSRDYVQSRNAGQPPNIGKLGRISARPTGGGKYERSDRRRRRGSSEGRYGAAGANQGMVMRRILMAGLIGAGVVICSLLLWTLFQPPKRPIAGEGRGAGGIDNERVALLTAQQATELAEDFLGASTASDAIELMRVGAIGPEDAVKELILQKKERKGVELVHWLESIDSLTVPMETVLVQYKSGDPMILFLTPDDSGRWVVDFDASTMHCEPALQKLAEGTAEGGLVRVIGRPEIYFNGPFRDETEWACYALTNPGVDSTLYGYCKRNTIQHRALLAIEKRAATAASSANQPVGAQPIAFRTVLRISRRETALEHQFEITSVVSDDWVISEPPFDTLLEATDE